MLKEFTTSLKESITEIPSTSYLYTNHNFEEMFPKIKNLKIRDVKTFCDQKRHLEAALRDEFDEDENNGEAFGCGKESKLFMYKRWRKLEKDL
jgi:hypothetical protein